MGLSQQYFDPGLRRDDYRGLVQAIQREARPSDAVVLSAPNQVEVFSYYYRGELPAFPLPAQRPIDAVDTRQRLERIRGAHERVWLVSWAMNEADPRGVISTWLAENGFKASHDWYGSVQLSLVALALPPRRPSGWSCRSTMASSWRASGSGRGRSRRATRCRSRWSGAPRRVRRPSAGRSSPTCSTRGRRSSRSGTPNRPTTCGRRRPGSLASASRTTTASSCPHDLARRRLHTRDRHVCRRAARAVRGPRRPPGARPGPGAAIAPRVGQKAAELMPVGGLRGARSSRRHWCCRPWHRWRGHSRSQTQPP